MRAKDTRELSGGSHTNLESGKQTKSKTLKMTWGNTLFLGVWEELKVRLAKVAGSCREGPLQHGDAEPRLVFSKIFSS